jgi:hypothetical protein
MVSFRASGGFQLFGCDLVRFEVTMAESILAV